MSLVKQFTKNKKGNDYVIGDIHGCFSKVMDKLNEIGFDFENDRLFSVGDLVDRGPECADVLKWLDYKWFHPVRGNHDDYVCRYDTCDIGNWLINGGIWFQALDSQEQLEFQIRFKDIPVAIQIEVDGKLIGIVHADCVMDSWKDLISELKNPQSNKRLKEVMNSCMWSRTRYENRMFNKLNVKDVDLIIVGHTPIPKAEYVGNVLHIDTAGWHPNGYGFTVVKLSDLL